MPVAGAAGQVDEPRLVVPLVKETVPVGIGAPVTMGMLKVKGSAVPTVVVVLAAVTASPPPET